MKPWLKKGVEWTFNPPAASHHYGIWERQIRTVRKVLNSVVRQQLLDDKGLQTLLCKVESIISGRPLTTNTDHPNDLELLTPNHLLLMNTQPSLPPGVFTKDDVYACQCWRQIQYTADLFWRRWTHKYLPLLQECQKRSFKIGDVVLVADSSLPRNSWMLGRITSDAGLKRHCPKCWSSNEDQYLPKTHNQTLLQGEDWR